MAGRRKGNPIPYSAGFSVITAAFRHSEENPCPPKGKFLKKLHFAPQNSEGLKWIGANNVTLRLRKGAFEEVNIKFTEGNCYGLIGANSAGKSTF